tara:strand:+ start:2401 stop:3975 length:1575 start_codon:yes stop_codon:yes gene_type:complete
MISSVEGLYQKLESDRYTYLQRARDAARLTIPTLFVDEGHTPASELPTPYQSVGARGVNNLSSALLLSLLPPNAPFFRLVLDAAALRRLSELPEAQGEMVETQLEVTMSKTERQIMSEIETNGYRIQTFEALKHLIVAGNVVLHITDKGGMRVIHLDRFVVQRDPLGRTKKVIIKEVVSPDMLPEEAKAILAAKSEYEEGDSVNVYTCIHHVESSSKVDPERVQVYQEIFGTPIPGTEGEFKASESPYIVLRMNRAEGENYGRGYVEQYLGDLKSLESLMMAVVEAAAAASKCLFMVAPNGVTRARVLAEAPNGAIVEGTANDVSVLQLNKGQDFAIASQTIQTISDRLAYAFLLTDNAIRQAERVTAAEVRLVTQSIERQLGGIYSVLSQEFQLPLVTYLMKKMGKEKKVPKMTTKGGKQAVRPVIVTGIEALGRGNDLNKIDEFIAGVGQLLGPEVLGQYINFREYLDRRALALGIDSEGLVKSEEEVQAEMQQQQQAAMMQQMGPEVMAQMSEQQAPPAEQ